MKKLLLFALLALGASQAIAMFCQEGQVSVCSDDNCWCECPSDNPIC